MPKSATISSSKKNEAGESRLKSFLPYLFPILSLALVVFMFFRWYNSRATETPEDFLNSESFQVEDLAPSEAEEIMQGITDFKSVALEGEGQASGEIRYQEVDGKLNFTVTANLEESQENYAVWLKSPDSDSKRRVFDLTMTKAGYLGSASVQAEVLPVEVIISKASDLLLQDVVLKGKIEADSVSDQE